MFADRLSPIFPRRDAVLVTDDADLAEWLGQYDAPVMTFAQLASGAALPPRVVAIPVDYGRLPSRKELRDLLAASAVLWVPLASFSSDLGTAKYAVERLLEVDFACSVALNRRIITRFMLAPDEITLSGPDTALTLRLPDTLQLTSRTRPELMPDEHSTAGNYFEIAMSPTDLAGRVDTDLAISGTVRVDSVLVAKHRELKGSRAARFDEAARLVAEMRGAGPFFLTLRDNRIVDGLGPWAAQVDSLSGPEYDGAITEVAIGTGALAPGRVDWSLNCLLNESAAGIHLGVGNGLNGMHFDFLATEASLDGF